MHVLVFLSIFVGAALAKKSNVCYSPNQWEGREIRVDGQQNYEEYNLSYDAINRRERKKGIIQLGSTRNYYDILTLQNASKEYIFDPKTRKCNTTKPSRPFYNRGAFPRAQFYSEYILGASGVPGESLVVKAFTANTKDELYYGLVTKGDCIPIQNTRITKKYGLEQSTYFDLTVGIKDPTVFTPPSECNKATTE